jgi:hypothetical protein
MVSNSGNVYAPSCPLPLKITSADGGGKEAILFGDGYLAVSPPIVWLKY